MKITVFGLTVSSSWGNGHATPYRAILSALHRRGHQIVFYEKDVEYYALRRDFSAAEFCKLVLYPKWEEVREAALRDCTESDVVLTASYCADGARINDEVLALAKPLRVFYDLDTPVTLKNLQAGDLPYIRRDQLSEFDLVLSWTGGGALHELRQRWGVALARPLFGCVDPEAYRRVESLPEFRCDMSYMGTFAPDRQEKVDEFVLEPARRRGNLQFVLAGTLYPWHWEWPKNVRRFDHVSPQQHPALYSSSRLTLNITRQEMAASGYCPSGRLFEAAACGAPIVSDWWEGLDEFFSPGSEILAVRSTEDVMGALESSDEELAAMAGRARERTLDENTGEQRAEQLLRYFDEADNGASSNPGRRESWNMTRGTERANMNDLSRNNCDPAGRLL